MGVGYRNSLWFTRGWTLQELLAPKIGVFYSRDHVRLGDRTSLEQQITKITGIAIEALQGQMLSGFSIDEPFFWVEKRQTIEEEDKAYCLLGIFDVFLPLIYGEGQSKAMRRLRKEVLESTAERILVNISLSYQEGLEQTQLKQRYRDLSTQQSLNKGLRASKTLLPRRLRAI